MRNSFRPPGHLLILALAGGAAVVGCAARPRPPACGLAAALVMPDNDIDTSDAPSGVAVSLPEPVRRKVRELAQATIDARRADGDPDLCGDPEATVYGPVFEISGPLAADLYVFHRGDLFGASDYLFMLFDPASGRITADPVNLYGKWMDGDWGARLEKPLVSFTDLDGDGIAELVVEQRVHNGTMYNAVVYHYFRVEPDLALRRVLALETRRHDLDAEDREGLIVRTLHVLRPDTLRIDVALVLANGIPRQRTLGYVILTRRDPAGAFTVAERHVVDQRYRPFLISASGEAEDDEFLRNGYTFRY